MSEETATPSRPAPGVARFTTRYVVAEDRIQIAVEMKDGEVRVLWVTRRLFNRLLPALLRRVENGPGGAMHPPARPSAAPSPRSDAVQRFNQQAATSGIKRQKGVSVPEGAPDQAMSYLVTSVDLRDSAKGVFLDFKGGETVLSTLTLGDDSLRQWLSVVKSQYDEGQWRERFWPSWMDPPDENDTGDLLLN